jgi:hypothetical protein
VPWETCQHSHLVVQPLLNMLELLHTHLGFIFPKVIPCLLVINGHYPFSYILGENILFQLTLQFD